MELRLLLCDSGQPQLTCSGQSEWDVEPKATAAHDKVGRSAEGSKEEEGRNCC